MTDKEKYMDLMQRYWDAETTPDEERDLTRYVANTVEPEFEELRAVLGYLSIAKGKRSHKADSIRFQPIIAVAAAIASVFVIGFSLRNSVAKTDEEFYVCYSYGEEITDDQQVMESIESSLADFFYGKSPVEDNLFEMFKR